MASGIGQKIWPKSPGIRVSHLLSRVLIHLVLGDHVQDLPPAVALLQLALHVSTLVGRGGNLLGLSLVDFLLLDDVGICESV